MDDQVTVIMPALNEEAVIAKVIERVRAVNDSWHILIVDDGSTDRTAELARAAGAEVVSHPYRKGNGAAVKSGIRAAKTEYVVLLDSDGQHPPERIPDLLEAAKTHELVVAARTGNKGALHRNLANSLYNRLASYVAAFPIPDLTSGFRVFHRATVLRFLYLFPNSFSYPTTSTLSMLRAGHSVKFIPVEFAPRVGKSKISLLSDGVRFLLIIFRITMMFSPLRIFFPLFLGTFAIGATYLGVSLARTSTFPPAALFILFSSVLLFAMGLLSEQIAQLRLAYTEVRDDE